MTEGGGSEREIHAEPPPMLAYETIAGPDFGRVTIIARMSFP